MVDNNTSKYMKTDTILSRVILGVCVNEKVCSVITKVMESVVSCVYYSARSF